MNVRMNLLKLKSVKIFFSFSLIMNTLPQLTAFKPACSKPGNSEVYLVALGFRGIEPSLLQALKQCLGFCNTQQNKINYFESH